MKKTKFNRVITLMLCVCMVMSLAITASAASVADATIDTSRVGSIELYKFDLTNAEKDGVWKSTYVSTGVYDKDVNKALGGKNRVGDNDTTTDLGNGETSTSYAIKGVEFTYLKVAEIVQFSESTLDGRTSNHVEVLYGISKDTGRDLLTAIGLTENNRYKNADNSDAPGWNTNLWYFRSNVLINALQSALDQNSTTVKNALETYVKKYNGTAMPETDADGYTAVHNMPLGLYLLVETKVPEMVVDTTDPFFVSLPMTSVNGSNASDGGSRWIYDVCLYPKNLTGIPSLEKTLRESIIDTGKNDGSISDITDGYAHTGTASDGDVIEYQLISTLPSITSAATYLSEYTFIDTLSKGLSYNKGDIVLEFFTDEACTQAIAGSRWTESSGCFSVVYSTTSAGESVMTIRMTDTGLKQINTSKEVYTGESMVNSGYSDCTLRITYAATMESNNEVVYGDNGNPNDVVLTWRRTSSNYYDTLVDDAHIYTFGIDLTKTFSDNAGDFSQVEFVVQNETDGYYVVAELNEADGVYYVIGHTDKEQEATKFIPVAHEVVTGEGVETAYKVIVLGLEDDKYIITEVETADGYVLLEDNIEVIISVSEAELCGIYQTDAAGLIQNDPRYTEEIINKAIAEGYMKTDGDLADILNNMPQRHLEHNHLTASAKVDTNEVIMLSANGSENAKAPLDVINTPGFNIPDTGELGAIILPLLGTITTVAAFCAVLFLAVARKKNEQ